MKNKISQIINTTLYTLLLSKVIYIQYNHKVNSSICVLFIVAILGLHVGGIISSFLLFRRKRYIECTMVKEHLFEANIVNFTAVSVCILSRFIIFYVCLSCICLFAARSSILIHRISVNMNCFNKINNRVER